MHGLGAVAQVTLLDFDVHALTSTADILDAVVTRLRREGDVPPLPNALFHYTSLEAATLIIERDDVRLCHAEYSNDQMEMGQAKAVIENVLAGHAERSPFAADVLAEYVKLAPDLDAYIFCMSTGGGLDFHYVRSTRERAKPAGQSQPVAGIWTGRPRHLSHA
jgi:hypothetical protein